MDYTFSHSPGLNERQQNTIKERYAELARIRQPYLDRARLISVITKPYLLPDDDTPLEQQNFPTPWQRIGGTGTSSFANKLCQTLFPYQVTWAQFSITNKEDKDFFIQQFGEEEYQQIEYNLACREEAIRKFCETTDLRTVGNQWFEHAIIAGNVLAYIDLQTAEMRCFGLNRYVVKRANSGAVQEIIIKDAIRPSELPGDVIEYCGVELDREDKAIPLYSWIKQDGRRWVKIQELEGVMLPEEGTPESKTGAWASYPLKVCPYIPMRWRAADGEDYGRGFCDDFYGDLYNLEVITKSIMQGVEINTRFLIGIKPGATADADEIATAENGAVITADFINDVRALEVNKTMDLKLAEEFRAKLERELSLLFREKQGIQREGERVTATEIQELVNDLNENMGSVFALFMKEVQRPVIQIISRCMERQGKLSTIPEDLFDTTIITGMEALGRQRDLQKKLTFLQILSQTLTPQYALQYIKAPVLIKGIMTDMQFDMPGLVKTTEELAQEQQQAQEAQATQLMSQYAGPAAQVINKAMEVGSQGEQPAQTG